MKCILLLLVAQNTTIINERNKKWWKHNAFKNVANKTSYALYNCCWSPQSFVLLYDSHHKIALRTKVNEY